MTDDRSNSTVGFVGLGNMGLPMADRLVRAGFRVRVFDISEAPIARLVERGAVSAASPAEAARGARWVVLMLPSSTTVSAVVRDVEFLGALSHDALVVDMSSSEPTVNQGLARLLADRGVRMVDAPVSGGVAGAQQGTLTIMAGGNVADVEDASALFSEMGRVVHTGGVGSGDAVKALNNLLSATHLCATGEVMAAGAQFGLDPDVMLAVFNSSSGRSGSTEAKWPRFVLPEKFDSGFGLGLMLKDMRIAVQLCAQTGLPARLGEKVVEMWAEAAEELEATADHTEIARWLRAPRRREERSPDDQT